MSPTCVRVRGRITFGIAASLAFSIVAGLIATVPAEARHHYRFHRYGGGGHHRFAGGGYHPPFSAIVVDAKAGKVLYSVDAKALRHPASITKVMTLYLLFEQLERGTLSMDSQLRVSQHAASMAPTKLGLSPGETITVGDAIKAVVTQSANDMAVAIAEALGGSEDAFAEMMTRKANALGMNDTRFVNASGLPDDRQITTAYDLSILARAIQERFPRYYPLFATRSFSYGGMAMHNHNHLLGRIEGLDGIKTGYTRASGFNLMTNVRRDRRQIVAVILGGTSAAGRDRIMEGLIAQNIELASEGAHTAPALAEASERPRPAVVAEASEPARPPARPTSMSPAPADENGRLPATIQAYSSTTTPSSVRWSVASKLVQLAAEQKEQAGGLSEASSATPTGKIYNDRLPAKPAAEAAPLPPAKAEAPKAMLARLESAQIPPVKPQTATVAPTAEEAPKALATRLPNETSASSPDGRPKIPPGLSWMIQLGALPEEDKATQMLQRAKSSGSAVLARAESFTQKVTKDGATLYRARFAGFDEGGAQTACKVLKRNGFACFATRS